MKRNHSDPDFSVLYSELNDAFFDRVVSQIPGEVWSLVFEHLFDDKKIKYTHYWTKLTRVSKLFYAAVYRMDDIYINVNLLKGDTKIVIDRFTRPIQVLRMRCLRRQLILPPMPGLKKLKMRHSHSNDARHTTSSLIDFCRLQSVDFPQLTTLSLKYSCMTMTEHEALQDQLRQQITKLTVPGFMRDLNHWPSVVDFNSGKLSRLPLNLTQLKKLHIHHQINPIGFTGVCYIHSKRDYSFGPMKNGEAYGEWKKIKM